MLRETGSPFVVSSSIHLLCLNLRAYPNRYIPLLLWKTAHDFDGFFQPVNIRLFSF
ncbi:hypothetical protein KSC_017860 [Ktedonobacter sp. SOSP1-52]|nr:hypothetical protein KSC_017860 [Ktedonobacter sp. SOSP1-52]